MKTSNARPDDISPSAPKTSSDVQTQPFLLKNNTRACRYLSVQFAIKICTPERCRLRKYLKKFFKSLFTKYVITEIYILQCFVNFGWFF